MSRSGYSSEPHDTAISDADLSMVSSFLCDEEGAGLGVDEGRRTRRGTLGVIASPVKLATTPPHGVKRPRALFADGKGAGKGSPNVKKNGGGAAGAPDNSQQEGGARTEEHFQRGVLGDLFDADNSRSGTSVQAFKRGRTTRLCVASPERRRVHDADPAGARGEVGAGLHESQAGRRLLMPFCLVKPSQACGDLTLEAINKRILHSNSPTSVLGAGKEGEEGDKEGGKSRAKRKAGSVLFAVSRASGDCK